MMRGDFAFDGAHHRYTVGGWPVPSVTRIVGEDKNWLDPEYLRRGKAVHAAAMQHDLGARWMLPDLWFPYMQAYIDFKAQVPCRWRAIEQPRVNRRLRYAGTPDRIGTINGRPAILELKTGFPDTFHGPQLAGQDLLLPSGGIHSPRRRMALYLGGDGRFKLVEYAASADFLVFMDALRRYWEKPHDYNRRTEESHHGE